MRKWLWSSIFCLSSATAFAYPVLVPAKSLPWLADSARNALIAVSPVAGNHWKVAPLQIEEIEDGAAIVFRAPDKVYPLRKDLPHPSSRDPFSGALGEVHRLIVDDKDFETCDKTCASKANAEISKLCGSRASSIVQIELDFLKKSAFLANCNSTQQHPFQTKIELDDEKRIFKGDNFSYSYRSDKDVLLDKITLLPENISVLGPSEMQVYLKPKYMVNLRFKDKDLVSRITSVTKGPVGLGLEVAFALKVLGIKVNTQICCDISAFRDSFYFPVILDLPFEGSSFKTGSGLYYGLNFEGDVSKDITVIAPKLNDTKLTAPQDSSVIMMRTNKKIIAVAFRTTRQSEGPALSPVVASKDELAKFGFQNIKSKFGLYYDVTKLTKGFHNFNIWFYFGTEADAPMLEEYAKHGIKYKVTSL